MRFDYSKLRGRARECGVTQEYLASVSGMKGTTYSQKVNNNSDFTQSEILCICKALNIPPEQIHSYFFTSEVQKN